MVRHGMEHVAPSCAGCVPIILTAPLAESKRAPTNLSEPSLAALEMAWLWQRRVSIVRHTLRWHARSRSCS